MKPDTEQIIEALRAGAWAAEIKLMDLAADRLEELQKECDKARAEVERVKTELHDTIDSYKLNNLQPKTTRTEPSRLEIAAKLMGAHVYHLGMMYQEGLTLRQACLIEADALIAAAREAK